MVKSERHGRTTSTYWDQEADASHVVLLSYSSPVLASLLLSLQRPCDLPVSLQGREGGFRQLPCVLVTWREGITFLSIPNLIPSKGFG